MPDSSWRAEFCEHCRAGVPCQFDVITGRVKYHLVGGDSYNFADLQLIACTAPSADDHIAALTARIAELQRVVEKCRTRNGDLTIQASDAEAALRVATKALAEIEDRSELAYCPAGEMFRKRREVATA